MYKKQNISENTIRYFLVKDKLDEEKLIKYIEESEFNYGILMSSNNVKLMFDSLIHDDSGKNEGVRLRYLGTDKCINCRLTDILKKAQDNSIIKVPVDSNGNDDIKLNRESTKIDVTPIDDYGEKVLNVHGYIYVKVSKAMYGKREAYVVSNYTYSKYGNEVLINATMAFIRFCLDETPFTYVRKGIRGFYFNNDPTDSILSAELDKRKLPKSYQSLFDLAEVVLNNRKVKGILIYRYANEKQRYNTVESMLKSVGYEVIKTEFNELEINGTDWKVYNNYKENVVTATRFMIGVVLDIYLAGKAKYFSDDERERIISIAVGTIYDLIEDKSGIKKLLKDISEFADDTDMSKVFNCIDALIKKFGAGIESEAD